MKAAQQQRRRATQYSRQQIDQMIAPIALYPDQLLAQVLMAATYPQQLVEAAEWLAGQQQRGAEEATRWSRRSSRCRGIRASRR